MDKKKKLGALIFKQIINHDYILKTHFLLYSRLKSGLSLRRRSCALGTIFLIGSGHRRPHPLLPNGPRTQFGDCSYSSIPAHKKVSCFLELVAVAIVLPLSVVSPSRLVGVPSSTIRRLAAPP